MLRECVESTPLLECTNLNNEADSVRFDILKHLAAALLYYNTVQQTQLKTLLNQNCGPGFHTIFGGSGDLGFPLLHRLNSSENAINNKFSTSLLLL